MFKLRTPKQETRARDRTKTGCTDERLTRAQQDPLPQETITSCKEDAREGYISDKGEPLVLHRPSCPLNGTIIGVRGCSGSETISPRGCDHRFSRSHMKTLRTRKTKKRLHGPKHAPVPDQLPRLCSCGIAQVPHIQDPRHCVATRVGWSTLISLHIGVPDNPMPERQKKTEPVSHNPKNVKLL